MDTDSEIILQYGIKFFWIFASRDFPKIKSKSPKNEGSNKATGNKTKIIAGQKY